MASKELSDSSQKKDYQEVSRTQKLNICSLIFEGRDSKEGVMKSVTQWVRFFSSSVIFLTFIFIFIELILPAKGLAQEPLPYLDADFSCVSQSLAEDYVQDFNIDIESFGGIELCDAQKSSKKFFNDLEIVKKGVFGGEQKNVFINEFINREQYYSWMKSMTRGVRYSPVFSNASAYNMMGYFTFNKNWNYLSTLSRVGIFLHEGRHTAGHRHVPCNFGPYKGSRLQGCDRSLSMGGSHGIEMEYYSRVALQGENFHPVYTSMARMMNVGRANFVFNKGPMSMREALAVQTSEHIHIFDNEEERVAPLPPMSFEGYLMKRSSAGAVLFNGEEALVIDPYGMDHSWYPDEFSYYKLVKVFPNNFNDFEEFDLGFKRYIVTLSGESLYQFDFLDASWLEPITLSGSRSLQTVSPSGVRGLFVLREDRSFCAYDPERRACVNEEGAWPDHVVNYGFHGDRLVELRTDGLIYDVETEEVLIGGPSSQLVNIPIYDAYAF